MSFRTRVIPPHLAALRRVPSLHGCSERELTELSRLVDEVTVPAGKTLVTEGRAGREVFLIIDGTAVVTIDGQAVGALGPGQYIGEVAMLDHQPRTATVVAETPMRLFVVGPEAFGTFARVPAVAAGMALALVGYLRQAGPGG